MNVYDEAHNLSKAIKESNEFKEFDNLRKAVDADETLSQMIKDYHQVQMEMSAAQMSGQQINPDAMSRFQSVYSMLMTKPQAAEFLQAEMRFSIMMKDVYEILAEAMNFQL